MSISDFRMKKLLYIFNVFFDINRSGSIEKRDFEAAVEKIGKSRGWPTDSPQYKKTKDDMLQIWEGLRRQADQNKDGQVSLEEWVSMWNEYAKDPEKALEWQKLYLQFMFNLEDASGDGSIDIDEFTNICHCYGVEENECKEAFGKIASGKDEVDYERFVELWKQFFVSDDPSDPGNFIFGKTHF